VGVHKAMVEMWGPDYYKNMIVCGDSGGAVISVAIALGQSPEALYQQYLQFSHLVHEKGTINKVNLHLEDTLRELLDKHPNAYKEIEGRCQIGCTQFFSQHMWRTKWDDNDDLLQSILYSCKIPLYFKRRRHQPHYYVDGAYSISGTDFPHGDETLFIRVDDHKAEIVKDFSFPDVFFPILGDEYELHVQDGYQMMLSWDGIFKKKVNVKRPVCFVLFWLWCCTFCERSCCFFRDLLCCYYCILCCVSYCCVPTGKGEKRTSTDQLVSDQKTPKNNRSPQETLQLPDELGDDHLHDDLHHDVEAPLIAPPMITDGSGKHDSEKKRGIIV